MEAVPIYSKWGAVPIRRQSEYPARARACTSGYNTISNKDRGDGICLLGAVPLPMEDRIGTVQNQLRTVSDTATHTWFEHSLVQRWQGICLAALALAQVSFTASQDSSFCACPTPCPQLGI